MSEPSPPPPADGPREATDELTDEQALTIAAEIVAAMTDPMDGAYSGDGGILWQSWVVPSGLCYDEISDFVEGVQTDEGKRAQFVIAARAMIAAARGAVAVPAETRDDQTARAADVVSQLRWAAALDVPPGSKTGAALTVEDCAALLADYDRRGTDLVEAQRSKVAWSRSLRRQEIRAETLSSLLRGMARRAETLSSLLRGMARRAGRERRWGRTATSRAAVMQLHARNTLKQLGGAVGVRQVGFNGDDHFQVDAQKAIGAVLRQRADLADARAQVAAVRAIHQREVSVGYEDEQATCSYCREFDENPTPWPCPTIAALDGSAGSPRPKVGDRVIDGGMQGVLVRCPQCDGDGLLHQPDPGEVERVHPHVEPSAGSIGEVSAAPKDPQTPAGPDPQKVNVDLLRALRSGVTSREPATTGHMVAPGVPCFGCQICLVSDCEKCAVGETCAEHDPTDDMFGSTCAECGEPITDERPSVGEARDGSGPMHEGCGEPCVCDTAVTCLAHDHEEESDVYVQLEARNGRNVRTRELANGVHLDVAEDGVMIGVEVLNSIGVTINGRPVRGSDTTTPDPAAADDDDDDGHGPWSYTEFGTLCSCGYPVDKDERCTRPRTVRGQMDALVGGLFEAAGNLLTEFDRAGRADGAIESSMDDLRAARDVVSEFGEANAAALAGTATTEQPREPGYARIADAIAQTVESAVLELHVCDADGGAPVLDPYLRLARLLDKAGLIDWTAFAGEEARDV